MGKSNQPQKITMCLCSACRQVYLFEGTELCLQCENSYFKKSITFLEMKMKELEERLDDLSQAQESEG
jgi:hypothetical protein